MKDTIRNKLAAALAALLLCSALVGCGAKTASAGNASWGNASCFFNSCCGGLVFTAGTWQKERIPSL